MNAELRRPRFIRCLPACVLLALALLGLCSTISGAAETLLDVALTADTEGHVGPCTQCPTHVGLGGLARRATILRQRRHDLLLDAGNALFGEQSLSSGGAVIVAAYGAMGYDAVNISYRDFRLGKDATLKLLKAAPFVALSANLLDEQTGQALFKPSMVKQTRAGPVQVIGVTESPPGFDSLPHLRQQLAGIRIRPPVEAVSRLLPEASASQKFILLYYGSAKGLRSIQEQFPGRFAAIFVGGLRSEELPDRSDVPLVAAEQHGKSVAMLSIGGNSPPRRESISVTPDIEPDQSMQQLLVKSSGQ